jgi:hypothetical protein
MISVLHSLGRASICSAKELAFVGATWKKHGKTGSSTRVIFTRISSKVLRGSISELIRILRPGFIIETLLGC